VRSGISAIGIVDNPRLVKILIIIYVVGHKGLLRNSWELIITQFLRMDMVVFPVSRRLIIGGMTFLE
jgi:hypothetical protein